MRSRSALVLAILIALLLGGGSIVLLDRSDGSDPQEIGSNGAGNSSSSEGSNSEEGGSAPDDDPGGFGKTPPDLNTANPDADSADADVTEPDLPEKQYFVEGTVVGADGSGLSGAWIQLFRHRTDEASGGAFEQLIDSLGSPEGEEPSVGSARSDRSGRFLISVDRPGEYRLTASKAPLALGMEGPFRLTDRDPHLDLLVVLGGGLSIVGVVEDALGQPISGAEVSLLDRLEGELPGRHFHAHQTWSSSDGSFRFDGLEARRYILTANAPNYARTLIPAVTPPDETLHVALGEGRPLQIQVFEAVVEEGAASPPRGFPIDGETGPIPIPGRTVRRGAPIPGAKVFALNPVGFAFGETNAQGIAELRIAGEQASLRVIAPGYQKGREARVTIPDAGGAPEVVLLAPIVPLEGQVVRSDGTPAARAELLEVGFGLLGSGLNTFFADGEGNFQYDGSGSLLARLDGETSALNDRGGSSGEIMLRPTITVTGRLLRSDGWPASGADVRLSLRGVGGGGGDSILHWTGIQTAVMTGPSGEFTFTGVPDWGDRLEVVIYSDGSPDLRLPISSDLDEIVLGEEATLSGILRTPEGGAPSAAALILELPGSPPVRRDPTTGILRGGERVLVASDGSFFIGRLSPSRGEPLSFTVVAPPYLEERRQVTLRAGENGPLEITLRPGGDARVVVSNADGTPRVAAEVRLSAGRSGQRLAYTGPDGIASFSGLAPATYQVTVEAGPSVLGETVEVVAGELSEVIVDLGE